ncbi:hypothetical protein OH76DRAFT_1483368 [Lentinus brumalis]|uniref:Uncharacterized protein n=1 Tax=Lentinus brumalis TaxID=2498619 RepID=A0A371D9E0_9APHY|nr:hypothetical protein OH76DRAFT_1483368 [Polyporus brumalis]
MIGSVCRCARIIASTSSPIVTTVADVLQHFALPRQPAATHPDVGNITDIAEWSRRRAASDCQALDVSPDSAHIAQLVSNIADGVPVAPTHSESSPDHLEVGGLRQRESATDTYYAVYTASTYGRASAYHSYVFPASQFFPLVLIPPATSSAVLKACLPRLDRAIVSSTSTWTFNLDSVSRLFASVWTPTIPHPTVAFPLTLAHGWDAFRRVISDFYVTHKTVEDA